MELEIINNRRTFKFLCTLNYNNSLTLSPSHPPLWRIDLPAVEKILKKNENVTISTSFIVQNVLT